MSDMIHAVPDLKMPVPPSAQTQVAALRQAFPRYMINVICPRGNETRYEAVSRDGGNPYCVISTDAKEIWAALKTAA